MEAKRSQNRNTSDYCLSDIYIILNILPTFTYIEYYFSHKGCFPKNVK